MPAKKTMNFLKRLLMIPAGGVIAVVLGSCSHNSNTVSTNAQGSTAQTKSEPTPQSAFERDMQYVRNSQFAHVWVFSRKDGKVLDKDDAAYLRTNAPQVVDWVTTDEGKKVIAGTNFDLEQGNMNLLRKRFAVEDYTGK